MRKLFDPEEREDEALRLAGAGWARRNEGNVARIDVGYWNRFANAGPVVMHTGAKSPGLTESNVLS